MLDAGPSGHARAVVTEGVGQTLDVRVIVADLGTILIRCAGSSKITAATLHGGQDDLDRNLGGTVGRGVNRDVAVLPYLVHRIRGQSRCNRLSPCILVKCAQGEGTYGNESPKPSACVNALFFMIAISSR